MPFIYYIVSGESMEILQFLLSFFLQEYGGEDFKSVFDELKENSFDLKSFLNNLTPEKVAPIIRKFTESEKSPSNINSDGLSPIANIADRDIIYTLNGYFAETD